MQSLAAMLLVALIVLTLLAAFITPIIPWLLALAVVVLLIAVILRR